MSRFSQTTSFWESFPKGGPAVCRYLVLPALWQSNFLILTVWQVWCGWFRAERAKSSLKDKTRNKPQMNQPQEWAHLLRHIISLHLTLSHFTSQQHCLQVETMQCDLHQDLFYSRVQDLFLDFPGLKNWTWQKLLWKPRRKITDR